MSIRPETSEGYLYYIRLNTEKGDFYKIGFTKMESVEERFSYGGSENYKLIDKIFMYKYSMYAYDIELLLHNHLSNEKAYHYCSFTAIWGDLSKHPFFRDGQTELYRCDVLGLDPDYKKPFSVLAIFKKTPKCDLVRTRGLSMANIFPADRENAANHVYRILDSVLMPPFFESKREFIEKRGDWVVSLQRWAINNCLGSYHNCGLDNGKTIHGGNALPSTKSALLQMKEFIPLWGHTETIPSEIGHLKNLEVVRFPFYTIKFIPTELYSLINLRILDLSSSEISSISKDIIKLQSLEELNIEYCENILQLPSEIENLPNLKRIIISKEVYDTLKVYLPNKPQLLSWDKH
jgi:hypothetical protein